MANVEIAESLLVAIQKKFDKRQANEIIDLMQTLEEHPAKGKLLGNVGGIVIKELRYGSFRFYFLTDGFTLRCMDEERLKDLLLRFVRMSDKKHQQETIEEIRRILMAVGMSGFK
ncbi:TPA: hypothetical protein HA251_00890 [Candidatus Woesearchaeota archaeon]|nr:hypothetical protein [Candidatus Woesearchaeota archaeon]